jgi:hypothetical protein
MRCVAARLQECQLKKTLATFLMGLFAAIPAVASPRENGGPLAVDADSHVVVMEYEAWFGPHAVTFQNSAAKPLLQSADMQPVGGGYDSADPAVIKRRPHSKRKSSISALSSGSILIGPCSIRANPSW